MLYVVVWVWWGVYAFLKECPLFERQKLNMSMRHGMASTKGFR